MLTSTTPGVVDHHPGRRQRASPRSYLRQTAYTMGARRTLCRAGYYQLRQLRTLIQSMTTEAARTVALALCLIRQSLSGQAPLYLADDCCFVSDSTRRSLRSADVSTCVVPRTFSSYGDRTFTAAASRLFNSLSVQLRNPDLTYKRQLKGHLFGKHERGTM